MFEIKRRVYTMKVKRKQNYQNVIKQLCKDEVNENRTRTLPTSASIVRPYLTRRIENKFKNKLRSTTNNEL